VWRIAPVALSALAAGAFLAIDPRIVDFPASEYRTELFDREGFTIWNGQWYGGHHTPAYSVVFPPLSWLLGGPVAVGVVSALACAALFEPLARHHFGPPARWGAALFGLGTGTILFTGRVPFGLGVAIGLGALLALQRGRPALAAGLAAACGLTSPIAGLFLALAAVAYALASWRERRGEGLVLAAAAVLPPLAVTFAFPEGGNHPFAFKSLAAIPVFCALLLLLLPARERALRVGVGLYLVLALAAFAVDNPVGKNAVRLGELFAAPLLLCALAASPLSRVRAAAGAVVLVGLFWWQWREPVIQVGRAEGDPSGEPAYFQPLLDFLERAGGGPWRVEVPFTRQHWEAAEVAPRFPLARGWHRQVDTERNALFYDGTLDASTYRDWLAEYGVRFVALPDAPLDKSAHEERELILAGQPYLAPRGSVGPWRIWEVTAPRPMTIPDRPADISLAELGTDSFTLAVRRPGDALVRVHWTPYWRVEGGCVERDGDWTRVTARRAGSLRVSTTFAPARIFDRGRRCD
jgi:hypothetical protein